MTRTERLQQSFTKTMRLIEIGASHNPIIPKADGWQTTVVDHADRSELVAKYHGLTTDRIEEVDFVWRDGPLIDAIPAHLHGSFDGMVTSHVGEHMPDFIGFLSAAAQLLKPMGSLVLALPDKRLCFDFFQPHTTTGDLLDARGLSRHSVGTLFDHAAYFTARDGVTGWLKGQSEGSFHLVHDFAVAQATLTDRTGDYVDAHTWHFTPASFRLLILELNLLRLIPWDIERLESADGVEFYVWLQRREVHRFDDLMSYRLQLLQDIVMETKEQIAQFDVVFAPQLDTTELESELEHEPPPPVGTESSALTISAIVPLYNGAKFIEESLRSILAQTLPPNEIIVVDDGSTDHGPELVAAMAKHHPITLLTKPNGGQSSARNFGVAHSTGDLIALLDQDDIWYPRHLELLIEPFQDPPIGADLGWVYSNLDEIDTEGRMIAHSFLRTHRTPHPKHDMFECLREDMFVLPSASLISRKAFDVIGGFDERLSGYEDDDLFLRIFRAGYGNLFLEQALSKWRIYPESSSYSYRMRRSRQIYAKKLIAEYKDDPERARFIRRDLLVPRFYGHALAEYVKALRSRDAALIEETRQDFLFILGITPQSQWTRKYFGYALTKVHSHSAAQMVFATRHVTRPIVRRILAMVR